MIEVFDIEAEEYLLDVMDDPSAPPGRRVGEIVDIAPSYCPSCEGRTLIYTRGIWRTWMPYTGDSAPLWLCYDCGRWVSQAAFIAHVEREMYGGILEMIPDWEAP